MAKLTNGVEYTNPSLQESFAEYLLSNKFEINVNKNDILFFKPSMKVYIRGVSLDLFLFDTELISWVYNAGYVGIDHLDINGFIMLLHIMKIQDINKFSFNAHKISHQHGREADVIIKWLHRSLQVSPSIPEPIPS